MNEKPTKNRPMSAAAVIVAAFVCGLLIPSPLFVVVERLGGRRIFLARDTTEMIMPDGSVYEGTLNALNGKFDGYGALKTTNGGYVGKWKNGRLVVGKYTNAQMSYEGRFDNGLALDGFGTARYNNDRIDSLRAAGLPDSSIIAIYIGNFANGAPDGLGRAVMADSTMLFGEFRNGDFTDMPQNGFRVGETVYGIDISHFQPDLDWDNFALRCDSLGMIYHNMPVSNTTYLQPVFFVYIKATEGAKFKDAAFASNMTEARRHGIARGAYHFLRLNGRVETQIDNFTETAWWRTGDLPPVLDVEEEDEILSFGVDEFRDFTYNWLKGVETKLGVKPMIYTTDKLRELYLKPDARFDEFDYWTARYSRKMPENPDWRFWQFSDKGALNGYDAAVDLDVYGGDLASFDRYRRDLSRQ